MSSQPVEGVPLSDILWRTSVLARASALAVFVVCGLGGSLLMAWSDTGESWVWIPMPLVFIGFGCWLLAFRPWVLMTSDRLVVKNPVGTRSVLLRDIVEVTPGYAGLEITLVSGGHRIVWAVQQANINTWLGRHTRSTDVAEAITDRATLLRGAD